MIILYSCNFGRYDQLKEIPFQTVNYEFLFFNDKNCGRRLFLDPQREARYYKTVNHPGSWGNIIVWIDANAAVLSPRFLNDVVDAIGYSDILTFRHPVRQTVLEEAEFLKTNPRGKGQPIDEQMNFYQSLNDYNWDFPLAATGLLARRINKKTKLFDEVWWDQIRRFSTRDQLSFPYAVQKSGCKVSYLENQLDNNLIDFRFSHGVKYEKIAIAISVYIDTKGHLDMMVNSLKTFQTKRKVQYYAVINHCNSKFENQLDKLLDQYEMEVHYNDINCLARAWNYGIKRAKEDGYELIYVPNIDIDLAPESIDNLIDFMDSNPKVDLASMSVQNPIGKRTVANKNYELDYVTMYDNFSSFMIRSQTPYKLAKKEKKEPFPGWFDENIIPVYGEDTDYQYRLEKAKMKHICVANSTFYHHRSQSIKQSKDPAEARKWMGKGSLPYMLEKYKHIKRKRRNSYI